MSGRSSGLPALDDTAPLAELDALAGSLLVVDVQGEELTDPGVQDRFWSKVVRGPGVRDCWIWVGAIADDGYGRFWVSSEPPRTVSAHRFAYELVTGEAPSAGQVIEHAVCDNPVCVRFVDDPETDHLWLSTQGENLRRRSRLGRDGRALLVGMDRASVAARSRRLRAAVTYGWDEERVRAALEEPAPGQLALW